MQPIIHNLTTDCPHGGTWITPEHRPERKAHGIDGAQFSAACRRHGIARDSLSIVMHETKDGTLITTGNTRFRAIAESFKDERGTRVVTTWFFDMRPIFEVVERPNSIAVLPASIDYRTIN